MSLGAATGGSHWGQPPGGSHDTSHMGQSTGQRESRGDKIGFFFFFWGGGGEGGGGGDGRSGG